MRQTAGPILAACLALLSASYESVAAEASLSVCVQANDPPLSSRDGATTSGSGFDVSLAHLIAEQTGRTLRVQWFIDPRDPDNNPVEASNALLSDGRCQLIAEYPLIADTPGRPDTETAGLPPFTGAKPADRHRWVKLGVLIATQPYRFDALTVVLAGHAAGRTVHALANLHGLRIGVAIATLAAAILMHYHEGELARDVVHMPDEQTVFAKLQQGDIDAALVDLHNFDAWRLRRDNTDLVPTNYIHSLGFNMGFVGLASERDLIAQVNTILSQLMADNAIAPMAHAAGVTYLSPRPPDIRPDVAPAELDGD